MTEQDQHAGGSQADLWLEAPLHIVAASNYLRFGAGRRGTMDSDPDLLPVSLSLTGAAGACLYTLDGLHLVKSESGPRQIVWSGIALQEGIQIGWVWDFFRVLSHVILRRRDFEAGGVSRGLVAALGGSQRGDSLWLRVDAAGGFAQQHALTEPFLAGWASHPAG